MAQETKARESASADSDGHTAVGRRVTRLEGAAKVTGKTVYADDMKLPGLLHASALYAPHAHARIRSIDTAKAAAYPGVYAVITASDLPDYNRNDSNRTDLIFTKEMLLADPIERVPVRKEGE